MTTAHLGQPTHRVDGRAKVTGAAKYAAESHVPVNADGHDLEVLFVEEHDEVVNPLGAKGLGEPGVMGVAAAVANAIFHATGTRVRDLPITLDKLL